jgi:FkbM family methyltransferase
MFDRIIAIKNKGYVPDLILDIGAEKGSWTNQMMLIYPDSEYALFEAINYNELQSFRERNIKVCNDLLYETETEVDWYEMRNTGDSIFKERGQAFYNCTPIKRKTSTLDILCNKNNILVNKHNILIKIDCQGSEISIVKGASNILAKTDFIILEIPLFGQYNEGVPDFLAHIQYMDSVGFIPYDIAENHYINGFNRQIDMIFISKTHPFNGMTEFH